MANRASTPGVVQIDVSQFARVQLLQGSARPRASMSTPVESWPLLLDFAD
jgi:hypothetical protein